MFANFGYKIAPPRLQEALIAARARLRATLREGKAFRKMLAQLQETQWLEGDALSAYHEANLRPLLTHAATHVPFYRELAKPEEALVDSSPHGLHTWPLLDKALVREAGQRLLSDTGTRPLFEGSTSGTTGTPLTLFQDLRAINRENAFIWRQLQWAGFTRGARRAWIRGDLIVPVGASKPPFWRRNRAENTLMLSSYHLSEPNASAYLEALARFDPVVIQAYPSSIGFLAAYLDATGRHYEGTALKGVVTSSESVRDDQRHMIEARFGCRVFDWYGQFERVAAIGTCEHGQYHVMSDYSYVEFLPASEGLFEIVGTGYNNLAMPLIRYRTGDFVELDEERNSCSCGRAFPVLKRIHGRTDDYIKLRDGRRISRLGHVFKGVDGILEAQIVQDSLSEVVIRVVPGLGYGVLIEQRLKQNAKERLGDQVHIMIEPVQALERTRNGKLRTVVCNI